MSDLVRVTLDKNTLPFTVEYGEEAPPGLTPTQLAEKDFLENLLKDYSDFATAEASDEEERLDQTANKKRLEQLKEIEASPHIVWVVQEDVQTVAVLLAPELVPVYFENAPQALLESMLERPIIVNNSTVAPGQTQPETTPMVMESEGPQAALPDTPKGMIIWILERHQETLINEKEEAITWDKFNFNIVKENPEYPGWTILTTGWLGDAWSKLRDAFDAELGGKENVIWVSDNRDSHWRLNLQ